MAVRVYLEIGHEASIRTKKTQEGFTHDWEVFVRGCDAAEIQYYVEKVVFYLHETFPKPKRVVKDPPYTVKESGYAGFNLPIDIYLRNNNEPKKIRFNYDLHLQQSGPPILKVQKEKYIFNTPTDDFKMKVLKGGGMIGSSSSTQEVNDSRSSLDDKNQMTNKPKLSGCDFVKKQKMKMGEPCRDFQELFGSPINMSSKMSEQKLQVPKQDTKGLDKSRTKHSPHKESHKDKEKKEKTDSDKKSRDEKKQKEKTKDRERSKDKNIKKEKSPRPKSPSPKRSSPSRFSSPPVIKHKESKQHDKEKREKVDDRKSKKRSKEHKENKHVDEKPPEEHKEKNRNEQKREDTKIKIENASPPQKIPEKKEKSSKEKKEDRYSEKYKHKKKDKEKREKKEEKPYKSDKKSEKPPIESKSLFKPEPHVKKEKINYLSVLPTVEDESSNSSTSSSSSSVTERQPEKKKGETVKIKEEKNQKLKKEKGYQENAIKCKRKSNSMEAEEPPEKVHKEVGINNNSDGEQDTPGKTAVPTAPEGVEEDYFGLLRDLQHKIMGLKDNSDLQRVVKLIAETGRYEVSAHTFDFDLCLLDRSTVQQLQDFFASET